MQLFVRYAVPSYSLHGGLGAYITLKKTALASVPPFLQALQSRFQVTLLEDLKLRVFKACSLGFPAYASLSNDEPKEKFPTLLLPTNSDTVTE